MERLNAEQVTNLIFQYSEILAKKIIEENNENLQGFENETIKNLIKEVVKDYFIKEFIKELEKKIEEGIPERSRF